jgi:hypothetical protein
MFLLCDHCVQQLTLATNVFKQHTAPCPLILAALTNSVIVPYPTTYFPSISQRLGPQS